MFTRIVAVGALPLLSLLMAIGGSAAEAQQVMEIGPKVKSVVSYFSSQVNVIDGNTATLRRKEEALRNLGVVIDAASAAGEPLAKYPGVTAAFQQIYEEQRARLDKERRQVQKAGDDAGRQIDQAEKIKGLSQLDLGYLKDNSDKLKRRLLKDKDILDDVAGNTEKPRYQAAPTGEGTIAGLDALSEDSYLPSGEFSESAVTGYMVVVNRDAKSHSGVLNVEITSGPATVNGGKSAQIPVNDVAPGGLAFVSFTISVGNGKSSYGVQFRQTQ